MARVQGVRVLNDYRLAVRFDDGTEGRGSGFEIVFSVRFLIRCGIRMCLRRCSLDEYGAIAWPNGADLGAGCALRATRRFPERPLRAPDGSALLVEP